MTTNEMLSNVERYRNNFFNDGNNPNNPQRRYPEDFLKLAERILHFCNSQTYEEKAKLPWQKVFSQDLSMYRRLKTLSRER